MQRSLRNAPLRFAGTIVFCWAFSCLCGTPAARAEKYGSVTVNHIPLYETHEPTRRGYAGYLFQIKNDGKKDNRVRIEWSLSAHPSSGRYLIGNERTVKVAPGQTAHLWLYQPPIETPWTQAAVYIDGRPQKQRLEMGRGHTALSDHEPVALGAPHGHIGHPAASSHPIRLPVRSSMPPGLAIPAGGFTNNTKVILTSRRVPREFQDAFQRFEPECHIIRSVQQPGRWPTNWIVYSRFDGIVITPSDCDALSPEQRTALADYLSAGGVVWIRREKSDSKTSSGSAPPADLLEANGFGTLLTGSGREEEFTRAIRNRAYHLSNWTTADNAASRMPVTEMKKAPVWAYLSLLIVYAIGIGPVLQVTLRRMRRRLWMVWILPSSAVALCLIVFVWSYLSEGFRGRAVIRSVAMLNQKAGRATSIGWAGFYSPLTDGSGLRFSTSTVLQPQWRTENHQDREPRSVAIDWTNGQHLTDGWLRAKTPIHLRFWKVEPRREKIAIRLDSSGKATATNALGADVKDLRVHLPDGSWRKAKNIPAGSTVALDGMVSQSLNPRNPEPLSETFLTTVDRQCPDEAGVESLAPLVDCKPGMYTALVDGHLFVNTAITNPAEDKGETLVIGVFEFEESKPAK